MWVRPIFPVLCLPLPVLRAQRPEEARHYPPLGDSAETGVALVLCTLLENGLTGATLLRGEYAVGAAVRCDVVWWVNVVLCGRVGQCGIV